MRHAQDQRQFRVAVAAAAACLFPSCWTLKIVTIVLPPERIFVLRLAFGLGVLLAAAWLFGAIAEDVVHHDLPLGTIDLHVAGWLHAHATPALTSLMTAISYLGAPPTVAAIVVAVAAILLWRKRRYDCLLLLLAVAGGGLLNWIIKVLIHRDRPFFTDPIVTLNSFSFPSGHTMGSTVLYGALAAIAIQHVGPTGSRTLVIAATACLIALVAFSRLYLGVHYLSDVLAGFFGGVVWLVACVGAVVALRRRNGAKR